MYNQLMKARSNSPKKARIQHPKAHVTFRRNFLPPLLGIFMALGIFGLLNAQWFVAQYLYRFPKSPASNELNIASPTNISATPLIAIPKIHITAPIGDVASYDQQKIQLMLRDGVVRYGYGATPGQIGNTVIVGHSSGQFWAPGNYKFVFTLLDKLEPSDKIYIDYRGTRYIYIVTDSVVVSPTNISVLAPTPKPTLTLITCTPVGTSRDRLVVHARQA